MLLVVVVHTLANSYGHIGQEMIRFFCLCYTMLKWKSNVLTQLDTRWAWGLLSIYLLFCVFICKYPTYTYATSFSSGYGFSLNALLLRVMLQMTVLLTGYLVIRLFSNKELWFTKYGKRTMNVYLLHGIIVLPFAWLFSLNPLIQ